MWTEHLFYRAERLRSTWKLRLGLLTLVVLIAWALSGWWMASIGRSLVCESNPAPSDAILVDNLDPDYLLFERATALRNAGLARRVLVPLRADPGTTTPNDVALGVAKVMAGVARLGPFEAIPTSEIEPYTLNAARDVRRFAEREHLGSVTVVAPLFRSRRSALVYSTTLRPAGITVRCVAVQGSHAVNTWQRTWHGIPAVTEQWFKVQYYRLYVLPILARSPQH